MASGPSLHRVRICPRRRIQGTPGRFQQNELFDIARVLSFLLPMGFHDIFGVMPDNVEGMGVQVTNLTRNPPLGLDN
jgi:hypothetical protein